MAAFTGSVSSLAAGHVVSASEESFITLALQALTGGWTSYSPVLTASAGTPAVGNGTWSGYYMQSGKLVVFRIALVFGSTSTYGTAGATLSISLPIATTTTATPKALHPGVLFDTSASANYPILGLTSSGGSTVALRQWPGTAGNALISVATNNPAVLGTGDEIHVSGIYETS